MTYRTNADDPHKDLIYHPADMGIECPHGHGKACECQLPRYRGYFVVPIRDDSGVTRHVIATMRQVHDGGMREYRDPGTDEIVGSSGLWYSFDHVVPLAKYAESLS